MSKNTLYFSTIEEANQYFPNGVPSNVLAIVGDGSQVLVSSDNATGNATQQYYNADLTNDEIVNEMVQTSYDEGHAAGYTEGEDADNYAKKYFTIEFTDVTDVTEYTDQDGELVEYTPAFSIGLNEEIEESTVYIRVNGGEWQHLTDEYISHPEVGDIIEIKATCDVLGDMLIFETADESYFYDAENDIWYTGYKYNIYGNIMSLLNGDDFADATLDDNDTHQFYGAFMGLGVIDARNLILPENTTEGCYHEMFMECKFLTHAPVLPATVLTNNCYEGMFSGCTALEAAPILRAATLPTKCYWQMFAGCTSLEYLVILCDPTQQNERQIGDTYYIQLFDSADLMNGYGYIIVREGQQFDDMTQQGLPFYNWLRYDPTTQSQYYSEDSEDFCLRLHGLTEAYDDGYTEGEASAAPSYTDQQKFAMSSSDMMIKGSLNNMNYGVLVPSFGFDTTIWTSLTQMAPDNYAVLYKWSGSTMTTLPFYSNYDEEVGASPVSINVGTQDELEIQDSLVYATVTLAVGDKICVGFYVSDEYSKTGQLSGITSASTLYTIQTAGDYIIVIYSAGYDDDTGDPLPPTTVVSSNPYNASGTVLPMQPVQS